MSCGLSCKQIFIYKLSRLKIQATLECTDVSGVDVVLM